VKGLIGKKLGMTSVFGTDGTCIACTVIQTGPCYVTAIKTKDNDGYSAIQIGFEIKKEKHVTKPEKGLYKGKEIPFVKYIKEIRDYENSEDLKVGQTLGADLFKEGESVKVTGFTKGKGFQGVVKRHGFGGGSVTHGQSDRLRAPGSIGASSYPSRVFKGQKMAGRKGNEKVTVRNLKVIKVIHESNLLLVKGAVPGANNGLVEIYKLK
jgi:large subunit ribosomal protein L3